MDRIILILLMGLFDRLRGSGWFPYSHGLGMLGMGVVAAFILNTHGWVAAYVVASVMLGAAPGWGNPLGAAYDGRPMERNNYEWWQIGPWRESTLAALIARGLMWGVLLLPVSAPATIAFTLAFVAAPYLARSLKLSWGWMEFGRGALVAILIITMG